MARADLISMLKYRKMDADEFNYNMLSAPPINYFLTPTDIGDLRSIALSVKYSSKAKLKKQMQNEIMERRGFKFYHAGTNRNVYRFLDDNTFLFKVMHSRSGINDNILEMKNQWYIAPACTKIFDVTQCGTVGSVERVEPITSREEFISLAPDIFDLISKKLIGKYVMCDIGTRYFRNFGLRLGWGPVILDFPYIYKLDGKKLYCNHPDPITKIPCGGVIDYDFGFNELHCNKCGLIYKADELAEQEKLNLIIKEGGRFDVKVVGMRGNEIVVSHEKATTTIHKPNKMIKKRTLGGATVVAGYGDDTIVYEKKATVGKDKKKVFSKPTICGTYAERVVENKNSEPNENKKSVSNKPEEKVVENKNSEPNENKKSVSNKPEEKKPITEDSSEKSEKDISIVLEYLDKTPEDEVDWELISKTMYMTQKFMRTHKDELIWELLPSNPNLNLTEAFIKENKNRIYSKQQDDTDPIVYTDKDESSANINTMLTDALNNVIKDHPGVVADTRSVMGLSPTRTKS